LLVTPGALSRLLLLLLLLGSVGRLESDGRAGLVDDLLERVSRAPGLDRVGLNLLALLINIGEGVEDGDVHLHVEVDARGAHRVARGQNNLQRILVSQTLHNQVVCFRLSRERNGFGTELVLWESLLELVALDPNALMVWSIVDILESCLEVHLKLFFACSRGVRYNLLS